jgi:hypothetical protein
MASQWLDSDGGVIVDDAAKHLTHFMQAMADGRISPTELADQEKRVADLMREVEPKVPADLRDKLTRLLAELTAFNIMQMLHEVESHRPKTKFRG